MNILIFNHPHLHINVYSLFRNLNQPDKQTMLVCKANHKGKFTCKSLKVYNSKSWWGKVSWLWVL